MPFTLPLPEESKAASEHESEQTPDFGTLDYIHYFSETEGYLPTPIDVSITGSTIYKCPELKWYNFDVYPHKVKLTNTGYTVLLGAKWRTERPYLEGGPFYKKHVLSQVHFHWGPNLMCGSEHSVDNRKHPGEMQGKGIDHLRSLEEERRTKADHQAHDLLVSLLYLVKKKEKCIRSEYMTQQEALQHPDGVVLVCYIIKYGVKPDERLEWIIEGFQRIREAQTCTRIEPYPISRLLPMFYEDYFLYWGTLSTVRGERFVIRWLVPRVTLFASAKQMAQFRKLWNPWDEPNLGNSRPLQGRQKRHVFLINPHWNQYNSLLPIPRVPEESISVLSPAYQANPWMLPPQNLILESLKEADENKKGEP